MFPTNKIIELNELIYTGAKMFSNKIGIPLRTQNRNTQTGWEIRLEIQIKKLRTTIETIMESETYKTQQEKQNKKTTADKCDNLTGRNK